MLVETREVSKLFRTAGSVYVPGVTQVTLSIARGSFVAIAGPSGSGKTTLLSLLGALDWPTSGEVLFDGVSIRNSSGMELARLRRTMGFVFQDFALIPRLPLIDNITYPLIPRGITSDERRARAFEWLKRLGIEKQSAKRPDELSIGERQRVAIARAMAGRPDVIFADEPTSNLDHHTASDVIQLFSEAHASGKTIIVSSHDPAILAHAEHVFRMKDGRLVDEN